MNPLATLVVHPTKSDPTRFGVVKFRQLKNGGDSFSGEIENLVEKPTMETAMSYRTNCFNYIIAGYYAFNTKIFDYIEKTSPGAKNEIQITDAIALGLEKGEKVFGVVHSKSKCDQVSPCEYWDVGIPEDFAEASRQLLNLSKESIASLEE